MESTSTVRNVQSLLTVSIFLDICNTQRKEGKSWNDVSQRIDSMYHMILNPLKIYKLQKSLQGKLSKLSKNKLKIDLENLKQTSLSNFLSSQSYQRPISQTSIPSTTKKVKEVQICNQVLTSQNKILKEIVTEQSQSICKLEHEKDLLSSKLLKEKKTVKQGKELQKQNIELKKELKQKKDEVKSIKRENYYKKLVRREKRNEAVVTELQDKKMENRKLHKKLMNLNQNKTKAKHRYKKMLDQAAYFRQRYEQLKHEKEERKNEVKRLTDEIRDLRIENEDLNSQHLDNIPLSTTENGRYNDNIRTCILELQSLEIPSNNVSDVIRSVSENICQKKIEKLPKRSTIQNIIDEGHFLAKEQVSEALSDTTNWDLFADGTSRDGKKIIDAGVHLSDKRSLSLGFQTVAREDADTVANMLQSLINETAEITSSSQNVPKSETLSKMLNSLSSLMSDRSSVMKKSNSIITEWRAKLLKENFPDDEVSILHLLYCSAHVLLGFHNEIDNRLQEIDKDEGNQNSNKESRAVKTIRTVCELLGPSGDERNGRREDWLAYMNLSGKTSKIVSYRANRFNNLFIGAEAIIEHKDDILSFVKDYVQHPNEKLKSIITDLQSEYIISQIRSLAIISVVVTAPLWSIFNSTNVHHLDLHQYFQPLYNSLNTWSTDSTPLLALLPSLYQDYPSKAFDKLYEQTENCKRALELLCSALLGVVKRQLSDHLENGIYGSDCSMIERQRTAHSKLTNLPAEHYFGDLDYSIRRKRNATVRHHSAVVMLKRNRTVKWIKQKSKVAQKILIQKGVKEGRKLQESQKNYERQVKRKRVEVIQKMKEQKEQREQKRRNKIAKIAAAIETHGGKCTSVADVDELVEKFKTITAKKQALRNQRTRYDKC